MDESVDLIISGGAAGVDTLAEKYADKKGISKLILRPDYKRYGKAAPIIRNKMMVDLCDALIVIWDGKSKGTKHTIDYAQKEKKAHYCFGRDIRKARLMPRFFSLKL